MTRIYQLVQQAKELQGIESDNAFAIKNGFSRAHVNNWKAGLSSPSAINYLRLAKAAGLGIDDALSILEAQELNKKQAGYATLPILGILSAVSLSVVTGLPYEAAIAGLATGSVYIMLNKMAQLFLALYRNSKLI